MQTEDIFIRRTYGRFLTPTILALLGTTFSSFGNTLLAGHFLGKEVLAVMNILSSFTFLFAMLGCLISIGAVARSSIAIGRQDFNTAGKYEWLSLVLSLVIPIIISVPCLINFRSVFSMLGGDAEAYLVGATYGRLVIAFGFLNTLMYLPFNFLRMIGKGRYGMYSFGAMGIIDIVLVFIFLKIGMGPAGVALGYVISMLAADASGLFFLFKKNSLYRLIGDRPSNFTIEHIDASVSGTKHTSIVTYGDMLYFVTPDGLCYYNGDGINQDRNEGIRWLKRAAEDGNEDAIAALEKLGMQ